MPTVYSWPTTIPKLFDSQQTSDAVWGRVKVSLPVKDLGSYERCQASVFIAPNAITSSPTPVVNSGTALNYSSAFTYSVNSDDGTYYDRDLLVSGVFVGNEYSYLDGTKRMQGVGMYAEGMPVAAPARVDVYRDKVGDVQHCLLDLYTRTPDSISLTFEPMAGMPAEYAFIDNLGPIGFLDISMQMTKVVGGVTSPAVMDGAHHINWLAGIVKRSAVGLGPQDITAPDIVCGMWIKDSVGYLVQGGSVVHTIALGMPTTVTDARVVVVSNYEAALDPTIAGYTELVTAIDGAVAPNGMADITPQTRTSVPSPGVGTTYAATPFTPGVFADVDLSECALVIHNGSDTSDMPDGVFMQSTLTYSADYDRESLQARAFLFGAPGFWTNFRSTVETV